MTQSGDFHISRDLRPFTQRASPSGAKGQRTPVFENGKQADALFAYGVLVWVVAFLAVRSWSLLHGGHALSWDVAWYSEIAKHGYVFSGNPNQQQVVAFLPLYPMIVALFARTGLHVESVLLLLPILFSVVGLTLIYKAIDALMENRDALWSMLLFISSPFSFYFLNGYSESLFLLLLGGFIYALVCKRSKGLAALIAGVATAVRPHALVFYGVYLCWEYFGTKRNQETKKKSIYDALAFGPLYVLGFFLVGIYFYFAFGDLALYKNIMTAWGFDPLSGGIGGLMDHFRVQSRYFLSFSIDEIQSGFPPAVGKYMLWLTAVLFALTFKRMPRVIAAYGFLLVIFVLTATEGTVNIGRHLVTNLALPVAIVNVLYMILVASFPASRVGAEKRRQIFGWSAIAVLCVLSGSIQLLFLLKFFNGAWVS